MDEDLFGWLFGRDLRGSISFLLRRRFVAVFAIACCLATDLPRPASSHSCQVANDHTTWEIDAQDLTMDTLRDWEKKCQGRPLVIGDDQRRAYAFIVNEAHTLSKRVVDRLKTALELPHVQANSVWCFTTTINEQAQRQLFDEDKTGGPFLSRAIELVLNHGPELELAFALRARSIADAEQLNGKPLEAYVDLVQDCRCNLRKVLQRIEAGEMLA